MEQSVPAAAVAVAAAASAAADVVFVVATAVLQYPICFCPITVAASIACSLCCGC